MAIPLTSGVCRRIFQADGCEQGDPLAPALFSLGQHGAAASRQPLATARSWHSWTTCTLSRRPVARVHDRACLDSVTFEVFAHCGIAPNLGKTRVLSLGQTAPPPGIGELGAEINRCQSEAPSCSACSSPARSSSEPGPTSGCKRSSACCRNYPSCHPVARGPTTPSAGPAQRCRTVCCSARCGHPRRLLRYSRACEAPRRMLWTRSRRSQACQQLWAGGACNTTGSACCILAWADGRPSRLPCTLPGIRGFLRAGAGKTVSDSGAVPTTCSWRSHAASVGRQSESFVGGPAGWCPPASTTQGRQTAARRRRWQLEVQQALGVRSQSGQHREGCPVPRKRGPRGYSRESELAGLARHNCGVRHQAVDAQHCRPGVRFGRCCAQRVLERRACCSECFPELLSQRPGHEAAKDVAHDQCPRSTCWLCQRKHARSAFATSQGTSAPTSLSAACPNS